jgi:late competence protein required for DNA uptake (superfamily II DNA/RNA helicase)
MNFINLPEDINIPEDILNFVILPFVPKYDLRLTNHKNWIESYNKKLQTPLLLERKYYRFLMRKNLYIIFDHYFNNFINVHNSINIKKYNKTNKNYTYKNLIFSNRLDEIIYFSKNYKIENRCNEIIHQNKEKIKNKFKKTRKRNIEWTN